MKTVLLTGSSGFLGKIIKDHLTLNRFNIITLSRSCKSDVVCDLSEQNPLLTNGIDTVIHAAGKAHSVPKSRNEAQEFSDVNVRGTKNLLLGLEKVSLPKQFIFISSVSVYGLEMGELINEEAPLLAKDPYGLSKIAAEQSIIDWCTQNNVIYTILRLPLLVGENPPGNLGAMIKAINSGYYFNIAGGITKKSMILALDVAKTIPLISQIGGVYNLTDGFHPSFESLSSVIATSKNKKKPLNMPMILAIFIGYLGDFLGNKAPVNSIKIKKIISNLTFDDSKIRILLKFKSESVIEYLKNNEI